MLVDAYLCKNKDELKQFLDAAKEKGEIKDYEILQEQENGSYSLKVEMVWPASAAQTTQTSEGATDEQVQSGMEGTKSEP